MLDIKVFADEAILRLDQVPKKVREALRAKYESIFAELQTRVKTSSGTVGKFLDPMMITSGISDVGSAVVGYIEYKDKEDKYPIVPKAAAFLQFRSESGGWVRTQLVMHPYPKAASTIEQLLSSSKPWILEQLEDAIYEARL